MANIDITDQGGGSLSNGVLQLENGVAMDTTLRYVADQLNTKSQLLLATNATTVEGTLKIKTANVEYLDVEDTLGNNRFTISKAVGSQKVDLDFASNPTGSTTIVGAIRTYKDGISLSNTMVFREDGNVGIGETTSPSGLLHVDGGAAIPRMILDADTNVARIFSFRTNDTQRWAFRIDDNETGTNAGSNFAIRRYNDAGTFIDAPFNITRSSGNIGVNTATTTAAKFTIKGSGSTSATKSLLIENSSGTQLSYIDDSGQFQIGTGTNGGYKLDVNGTARINNELTVFKGLTSSGRIATFYGFQSPYQLEASIEIGMQSSDSGVLSIGGTNIIGSGGGFLETKNAGTRAISFNSFGKVKICGSHIDSTEFSSLTVGASNASGVAVVGSATIGFQFATKSVTFSIQGNGLTNTALSLNSFARSTISCSLIPSTYTNAYNVYVDGEPIQGANITLSNLYSLYVNSGKSYFGGSVLVNTNTDIPSSQLTIESTTRGFLPPRMTTAQKNAIATPAAGLVVYDTTLNKLCVYTTAWETITSI